MRYVSPFEELGLNIDRNLDKNDLNLAKKRLLAELDLSASPTILRGAVEMTKNDIITHFDKLASVKNWDFHRLVAQDKALLNFLQKYEWDPQNKLLKEPKYDTPAFLDFISPHFLDAYKVLIINSLLQKNSKRLAAILTITPRLLTESDHSDAWFSVECFLSNWKDDLDEIAGNVKDGQVYGDSDLVTYTSKQFIDCLNLLPDTFIWFRDDYATSLFNLSAYCWNNEQHYRAIEMVKIARLLDISEDTEQMLDERIAWFEEQIGRSHNNTNTRINWRPATIARVLFFVFFVLYKLATCDNSSKPKNPSNLVEIAPIEYATTSPEADSLAEKYTKKILQKEYNALKTKKKADFERILTFIRQTEANPQTKLMNILLVDNSLRELRSLQQVPPKNGLTKAEIEALILDFKILQKERGLE